MSGFPCVVTILSTKEKGSNSFKIEDLRDSKEIVFLKISLTYLMVPVPTFKPQLSLKRGVNRNVGKLQVYSRNKTHPSVTSVVC